MKRLEISLHLLNFHQLQSQYFIHLFQLFFLVLFILEFSLNLLNFYERLSFLNAELLVTHRRDIWFHNYQLNHFSFKANLVSSCIRYQTMLLNFDFHNGLEKKPQFYPNHSIRIFHVNLCQNLFRVKLSNRFLLQLFDMCQVMLTQNCDWNVHPQFNFLKFYCFH